MNDKLENFRRARHKFIWFTDEIKTYPDVLVAAVNRTCEYFAEEDIGITDIGCFIVKKTNELNEFFCLYISDRRFRNLFSLYKQFREEYHTLTTGRFPILDMQIESILDLPADNLTKLGLDPKTVEHNVRVFQSYRRRITYFETLANKSLNRCRMISVKTRYRVLQRDKSTCQLCGRSAPDVELEVDHIKSVLDGGSSDDIGNLWTLCLECNRGKGPSTLWDEVIKRLRAST